MKDKPADCRETEVLFSFDKQTMNIVNKLGFAPPGCYVTDPKNGFIKEHAEKNRRIVLDYCKENNVKI